MCVYGHLSPLSQVPFWYLKQGWAFALALAAGAGALTMTCSDVSSLEPAAASIATPLLLVLRRLAFTSASRLLSRSLFCTARAYLPLP